MSYFRRSYGNFNVQDNRLVTAADYTSFSVTAPSDPRLPDGGGYTVSGFTNLIPTKEGQVDNFTTLAKNFGNQTEVWKGVDVGVNARLGNGVFLQGGTSTGRTTEDNCEILRVLPEISPTGVPYCHQQTNWLTQVKGLASYTIPRIDVSVAGTYQYLPGPAINANWVITAANAPSLGRPITGGQRDSQPARARHRRTGDALNQVDSALRQDSPLRNDAHDDQPRPLQRNERKHDPDAEQHLLTHRDDVAAADTDPAATVLQDRRAVRFLTSEAPEETPPGPTTPPKARPPTWTGFCH